MNSLIRKANSVLGMSYANTKALKDDATLVTGENYSTYREAIQLSKDYTTI